ncbi:MAG: hypothetical protein ABI655_08460, partial [Phenylobacterium sp.]
GGPPVLQFGLYNGRRAIRPTYRACSPIPENGPEIRLRLTVLQWLRWIAAVRAYPSQAWNWLGLWPGMFATFARRGGFACQALAPERVLQRPHAGRLHYEWMFRTSYDHVRRQADAALVQTGATRLITTSPATIRAAPAQ